MKTPRQRLGQAAEELAAQHLQQQGYTIVARNYRYGRAEVDLIARKDQLLLFVEVKARSSDRFGYPEEFVSPQQQERLQDAAAHYVIEHDWDHAIRFDIIAVLAKNKRLEVEQLEDAF